MIDYNSIVSTPEFSKRLSYQTPFNIHGVTFNLLHDDVSVIPSALKSFATDQNGDWNIECRRASSLGIELGVAEEADCNTFHLGEVSYTYQRDFFLMQEGRNIRLVIADDMEDGFFNFLRWFVPRQLIKKNHLILHSSAIINDGIVSLCIGPSGAGKSTISSFADESLVLGDDLNLTKLENGQLWAAPCPLGQRFQNEELFGKWYPVEHIFWLEKGEELSISPIHLSQSYLFLLSCAANLFWPELNESQATRAQELILEIAKTCPVQNLVFAKNPATWQQLKDIL